VSERPWTVKEAAGYLGVDVETVRRWARAGRLTALGRLPGGGWRFAPESVRGMLGAQPAKAQARGEVADIVAAQLHAAYARSQAQRRIG
jgi:excisionase family DNA binding protein